MTKLEAAIVTAHTGSLIGELSDMQEYIENKLGRPICTLEMESDVFIKNLRKITKEDFISITVKDET